VIIKFENRFDGVVELRGGIPVTSKKDADMHGIGINSIRNTVNRYGGTVSVKADNDNKMFTLVVMLPVDSETQPDIDTNF
jgi:sensor histidine kinase regulating citrate/malate metabolism